MTQTPKRGWDVGPQPQHDRGAVKMRPGQNTQGIFQIWAADAAAAAAALRGLITKNTLGTNKVLYS